MLRTQDLRVREVVRLLTPQALKAELPMTEAFEPDGCPAASASSASSSRRSSAIAGRGALLNPRHYAALEYGTKLNALRQAVAEHIEIVMRVYFEKPRTTVGWKGLINDPHLDGTYDMEAGLKKARRLLLDLTGMGLPAATEVLDPIVDNTLMTWSPGLPSARGRLSRRRTGRRRAVFPCPSVGSRTARTAACNTRWTRCSPPGRPQFPGH